MKYEIIKNTSNSCVAAKGYAICKDKQIIPGWFETKSAAQKHLATLINDEQDAEENEQTLNWWQSINQDEEYIEQQTNGEYPYK